MASVQHGDWAKALRLVTEGRPETYFGMAYTVRTLRAHFADFPHLVISLNAPPGRERCGRGEYVGLPIPTLPRVIPGRFRELLWARKIVAELNRYRPTHVLVRTGGPRAVAVLKWCVRRDLRTAVMFASYFDGRGLRNRRLLQKLVPLLNMGCVAIVGNHRQPATDSMIEWGVDPSKAEAYDWPGARHPSDSPVKMLGSCAERTILYAGTISQAKGVGDLVQAIGILRRTGLPVRLVAAGDGPEMDSLRKPGADGSGGGVAFLGRIPNDEVFALMLKSTIVVVPSRHAFSEGLPFSLTEALASRTPTVISDHPMFVHSFRDGEGVRIVPERRPDAIASAIAGILANPVEYERLSLTTLDAFGRVECGSSFADLLQHWH